MVNKTRTGTAIQNYWDFPSFLICCSSMEWIHQVTRRAKGAMLFLEVSFSSMTYQWLSDICRQIAKINLPHLMQGYISDFLSEVKSPCTLPQFLKTQARRNQIIYEKNPLLHMSWSWKQYKQLYYDEHKKVCISVFYLESVFVKSQNSLSLLSEQAAPQGPGVAEARIFLKYFQHAKKIVGGAKGAKVGQEGFNNPSAMVSCYPAIEPWQGPSEHNSVFKWHVRTGHYM